MSLPVTRSGLRIPGATLVVDIVAIELAFLTSYGIRFHSPLTALFPVTLGFPPVEAYMAGSLFVIPVWVWLFVKRGMYEPRRVIHFSDEFFAIVRVVIVGMLVVMAAAFFYRTFSFSRLVFGILFGTSIGFLSFGRWAVLRFERAWYRSGHDLRNVLIVGGGTYARRLIDTFRAKPSLGYHVVGVCSSSSGGHVTDSLTHDLGGVDDIPAIAREHNIDLVLITLGEQEQDVVSKLVRLCDGLDVELMLVPTFVELLTSQSKLKDIEGVPFMRLKGLALGPGNAAIKRAFDVVFAGFVLIAISPVFLVLMLLVKASSPGPVFFRQLRVGLDGRPFNVLKFRSMRVDAESATGPVWTKKNDPRTTRVGRVLRRFSLDELPQLINVLRGDMSLVGPRPERPHFVEQFQKDIPRYLERHRVKTGMTGWAQVNGLRGNAPIEDRTRFDVYYVENWSLVFDLKIILKTVRAVFFGDDAY